MFLRSFRVFFLCLFVWFSDANAKSSQVSPEDAAAAELLFQKGRDALASGDARAACKSFAESHRLDPAAGTVMNLATCEEKLEKLASAWEHWQQALRLLPESDSRREFAQSRVHALESELPRLVIEVAPGSPRGVVVKRNGSKLGEAAWGIPMPVDPGVHRVEVQAPGREKRSYEIEVEFGKTAALKVSPGSVLKVDEPKVESKGINQKTWAFAAGSFGVVSVGVAVVTGALLPAKRRTVEARCDEATRGCDATGASAARQGRTLLGVNTAAWIVGGLGLATGATLYLTAHESERIQLGVAVEDGARLFVSGSF